MNNKTIHWIARAGFTGWLVFEFLNWIDVLHYTLDFTWFGLMFTLLFIWIGLEWISSALLKSTGKSLPGMVFLLSLVGVSWDALGDIAHFYGRYEWYDQAAHTAGGASIGFVFFAIIWRLIASGKLSMKIQWHAFFAVSCGMLLGVLYELEEYIEDMFTGGNRLGSGVDTANDLMCNLIGAVLIILIASWYVKRRNLRTQEIH